METKEINVSEIKETIAESTATANAGATAPAPAIAFGQDQATQAALVAESVKAALEGLGFKKKEDPIVEAAAAEELNTVNLPYENRPSAEIIKTRNGQIKVYLPYDIRCDMNGIGRIIGGQYLRADINEFKYLLDKTQSDLAKNLVLVKGLDVFHSKPEIQEYLDELEGYNDDEDFIARIRRELGEVLKGVNEFYAATLGNIDRLSMDAEFSYDELTVLLSQPGIKIAVEDTYATICLSTLAAHQQVGMMGDPYLEAIGQMYARNGSEIQQFKHTYYFGGYEGKKSLKELGIQPVGSNPELKAKFLERGKMAVAVTEKASYMTYKGDLIRRGYWSDTAFRSTGRVMVDFQAMRTMDTNYRKYFGGTQDRDSYGYTPKSEAVSISDDVYLTFSPYVYGFSFTSKVWGEMLVDNITPINFREDAYSKLVMEENQKEMIVSLVETQLQGRKVDIIDGKGGGCIFLLAGEPGTGKTLTAEVTAEHLKRPLYMVGVGELGTSASELEENLRQVLDIASTWNAVLLLDECDIFMEARTDSNIQRNAMVGVFLRLLEYYQGVLFLTSNRAKNIDKAFYSRISMAINFPPLSTDDRIKIWENNLALNGITSLDESDIEYMAETYAINGRQIKTACRNAMALATKGNREVSLDDLCLIMDKGIEFQDAVFSSGKEDDMRLTGMHHDDAEEDQLSGSYRETILSAAGEELGFGSRFFRAIGNFFNTLGGK